MGEAGPPKQQTCEEATENTLGSFSSAEGVEQVGEDRTAVKLQASLATEQEIRAEIEERDLLVRYCSQHISPELVRLVDEFAVEVSEEQVLAFLRRSWKLLPENTNNDAVAEKFSSLCILAASCILAEEYNKAVYIMLLGAMGNELAGRGPKHLGSILEKSSTLEQVCDYCCFIDFTVEARSRSEFIKCLQLATETISIGAFVNILRALEEEATRRGDVQFHSLKRSEYHLAKVCEITATYVDDGSGVRTSHQCIVYSDTTLGWCTKINARSSSRYYRVVHNEKTLFLSSSGKKSLESLGIEHGDELVLEDVCRHSNNTSNGHAHVVHEKLPKSKSAAKRKEKPKRAKQKRSKSAVVPVLNEEQLAKQHRREHSQAMNPVLEALEPILRKIRIGLNNLSMQKTAPKVKHYNLETNASPCLDSLVLLDGKYSSKPGKACKVVYPVLVGEVSNLYKTSKLSPRHLTRIDLHGYTAKEATEKLDKSLPVWVDAAMKGNAPWVLGVDIISGAGGQVVSEAVKRWIRANEQVANRPKGLV